MQRPYLVTAKQKHENRIFYNEAGFTLIEILISSIILASLIYLATLSYSLFMRLWEQGGVKASAMTERYRIDILLGSSLESIYDYYVTDPVNERIGLYYPFFIGAEHNMEFITLSSVFAKGFSAIARLGVKQINEGARPRYQVIYEEKPLRNFYLKYDNFSGPFSYKIIVFDNVEDFRLRYFGVWQEEHKVGGAGSVPEIVYKWQNSFYGKKNMAIPRKLELTVVRAGNRETFHCQIIPTNVFKQSFFRREF